jgi:hypothetical protein
VQLLLYVTALTLGIATARISTIRSRGGSQGYEGVVRSITSFVAMLTCFALIVWGFAALSWYWPIAIFVVASVIVGIVINRTSWPMFYLVQPLISLGTIGIGLTLWIAYWPF